MAKKAEDKISNEEKLEEIEDAISIEFDEGISNEDLSALEERVSGITEEINSADTNSSREESRPSERLEVVAEIGEDQTPKSSEATFPDNPPAPANANDASDSDLAQLLRTIQDRPKSTVFFWTSTLTIFWLGACAAYLYLQRDISVEQLLTAENIFQQPQFLIFAAIAILPLLPL